MPNRPVFGLNRPGSSVLSKDSLRYLNNSFNKNILTLVTGNIIAFIIPIVLYPLLSRIFLPEDYALFGLYLGLFSFLEIASAGRYDFAVIIPEKDEDAISLVVGGMLVSVGYATLIMVLVLLFNEWAALQLNNPSLAKWLFLLPIALVLVSVSKLCNSWLIRVRRFKASSINKASQKIGEGGAQLTFGFVNIGNGLILGDLTGRLFNAVFSLYQSIKNGFEKQRISIGSIRLNLKRYAEFPKFGIVPSMLNTLGGMMPVFMISSYYSVEISGSFNFSRLILSVPFALIATGISQVLAQQVAERRNKNESIYQDTVSLAIKLTGVSLLSVVVLYFAGPQLFEFLFGARWRLSGEYTSVLIFSTAVSLIVSPFSMILVVLGRLRWLSYWQTSYFFAVSVLWLLNDVKIEDFLVGLVIVDTVSYSVYGLLIYAAIYKYEGNIAQLI